MSKQKIYNEEIAAEICALIADGLSGGLQGACQKLGINRRTVRWWADTKPEFGAALSKARQDGCDVIADQIIQIADAAEHLTDNHQVQAAKLRVDARRWILSKLRPGQYGDKVELTGSDGAALIPPNPEAAIPKLLQILAVLLPGTSNSELFTLATTMARKLGQIEGPKANGSVDEDPAD